MRNRLFVTLCVCLAIASFSGCPGAGGFSVALGNWLVAIPGINGHIGVGILANGAIEPHQGLSIPVGADYGFSGVNFSWQQVGNTFTLIAENNGEITTWVGTLQSATYMAGTWVTDSAPNNVQTFTASKAPSENLD